MRGRQWSALLAGMRLDLAVRENAVVEQDLPQAQFGRFDDEREEGVAHRKLAWIHHGRGLECRPEDRGDAARQLVEDEPILLDPLVEVARRSQELFEGAHGIRSSLALG